MAVFETEDLGEFTESEHLDSNYDFYMVDEVGQIGMFEHGGTRLLPNAVKCDRSRFEALVEYFESLQAKTGSGQICPDLDQYYDISKYPAETLRAIVGFSAKGIYCFSSYAIGEEREGDRSYFLVSMPSSPLRLSDLPEGIAGLIASVRIEGFRFDRDRIIPSKVVHSV